MTETTTDIIIAPQAQMRLATDVAGVSREIVLKTARSIQGRKYVQVEGWMAIATAHGCALSAEDVRAVDGGIAARGIVKRIKDGVIITTAEGFVGNDEKMWAGRPLFARRAMAQTRAMSRAARSAFAHVVVMIDSGLSTTPAEEMDGIEADKNPTQSQCGACERKEEEEARAKKNAATTAAEIKALFVAMGVKTTDDLKKALTSTLGYEVEGSLTSLSNEERAKVLAELRKHATDSEKASATNG